MGGAKIGRSTPPKITGSSTTATTPAEPARLGILCVRAVSFYYELRELVSAFACVVTGAARSLRMAGLEDPRCDAAENERACQLCPNGIHMALLLRALSYS